MRDDGPMTFLPPDLYAEIERSLPIACVDFVPVREGHVGLILRDSPYGRVWCHLGGRVLYGETLRDAIVRHTSDTLAVAPVVDDEPQPAYVYQWFPDAVAPTDATPYGRDTRKHAIGLSFVIDLQGNPNPQNEALDFAYFAPDALPEPLWPGCRHLLERLLS